jgi:hypothetical protein
MVDMTDSSRTTLSRPMGVETRRRVPNDAATTGPEKPKPTGAGPIRGEPTSTPIAKAAQAIENALSTFEDAWADIANAEGRGQLTMDGRAVRVADVDQSGAVDEAVAQVAARAKKADADYKAARTGLAPHSNTAVDALNHNQWWSRTVRELDGTPAEKLVGTAQRVIETAEGPELGWASVELPSYLRTRNVDDGWVNGALEQVNPKLKAAAETLRKAAQARAIISSNARAAKRAMASAAHGSYKRPLLVDPAKYDPNA